MEITKEIVENFLKSHVFSFQPNQQKLCYPKLERIFNRMAKDREFDPVKEGNGKIVEGHHRYLCSEILARNIEMKKGIHPENYRPVVFKDMSNGDVFLSRSTCNTKETIEFEGDYPKTLQVNAKEHGEEFKATMTFE